MPSEAAITWSRYSPTRFLEGAVITGAAPGTVSLTRNQLTADLDFLVPVRKRAGARKVFPARGGGAPARRRVDRQRPRDRDHRQPVLGDGSDRERRPSGGAHRVGCWRELRALATQTVTAAHQSDVREGLSVATRQTAASPENSWRVLRHPDRRLQQSNPRTVDGARAVGGRLSSFHRQPGRWEFGCPLSRPAGAATALAKLPRPPPSASATSAAKSFGSSPEHSGSSNLIFQSSARPARAESARTIEICQTPTQQINVCGPVPGVKHSIFQLACGPRDSGGGSGRWRFDPRKRGTGAEGCGTRKKKYSTPVRGRRAGRADGDGINRPATARRVKVRRGRRAGRCRSQRCDRGGAVDRERAAAGAGPLAAESDVSAPLRSVIVAGTHCTRPCEDHHLPRRQRVRAAAVAARPPPAPSRRRTAPRTGASGSTPSTMFASRSLR